MSHAPYFNLARCRGSPEPIVKHPGSLREKLIRAPEVPGVRRTGPDDQALRQLARQGAFAGGQLLCGLIDREAFSQASARPARRRSPPRWTLDELRAMSQENQITRHICIEGWSAIGR